MSPTSVPSNNFPQSSSSTTSSSLSSSYTSADMSIAPTPYFSDNNEQQSIMKPPSESTTRVLANNHKSNDKKPTSRTPRKPRKSSYASNSKFENNISYYPQPDVSEYLDYIKNRHTKLRIDDFYRLEEKRNLLFSECCDYYTSIAEKQLDLEKQRLYDYARNRVVSTAEDARKERRRFMRRTLRERKRAAALIAAGVDPSTIQVFTPYSKLNNSSRSTSPSSETKSSAKRKLKPSKLSLSFTAADSDGSTPSASSRSFNNFNTPTKSNLSSSDLTNDSTSTPAGTGELMVTNIIINTPGNLPSSGMTPSASETSPGSTPQPVNVHPCLSTDKAVIKAYTTMRDSIWKEICRREAPKTYRYMTSGINIRSQNARKTSQLASKEARRWQFRANKQMKDLQNRAKRSMREMLMYWKRNEREERENRRKAERVALDKAKKEEEEREALRQSRKLNFLITQTELYSHFVGKKISNTNPDNSSTSMKNVDFAEIDDNKLREIAMSKAQNAVAVNQERTKSFKEESEAPDMDGDELNFANPTTLGNIEIKQPKLLSCQLKEYQLKGLNWLVSLYEQGINGILADEMGLGKTVQSISVMAYLAEHHNIWGPYLVIAPASTLHNWQQEITKFVPEFKALPYWGNAKDRKILRKIWDRKRLTYTKDAPFHVLITSYQLVVADAQYFQKIKWQYMILDEAQAIKSSLSTRWKSLLGFHCRNRLLLTGTPIQNSMQELWALLHFIMPTLFDSHDEFADWFSKDIESHAHSNTKLNEAQLKRLHMILKPFMLRRVKKNVQSELGDKIEIDLYCDLTYRQKRMYDLLKRQISVMDLIEAEEFGSTQSLMNLVMQFRKVCNHPDLFEKNDTKSPLSLAYFALTGSFSRDRDNLSIPYSTRNYIECVIPKFFYQNGGILNVPGPHSRASFDEYYLKNLFSIYSTDRISHNEKNFQWQALSGVSPGEIKYAAKYSNLDNLLSIKKLDRTIYETAYDYDDLSDKDGKKRNKPYSGKISDMLRIYHQKDKSDALYSACNDSPMARLMNVGESYLREEKCLHRIEPIFDPRTTAPPVELVSNGTNYCVKRQRNTLFDLHSRWALYGAKEPWIAEGILERNDICPPANFLPEPSRELAGYSSIRVPSMSQFIMDSGKLSRLDTLLAELKANDHRVLVYFQMTRMMDMMEEYLTYRHYKYLRLDGSSKLGDRRDLVDAWQTRPELFVFLLSTRAGGLGINLTAADTVVFYDSDWNPTIDSQAMDRAHRLGQTRQVTVYRLLVRGTIEERMRDRAKQKMQVQQVVMEGKTAEENKNMNGDAENRSTESNDDGYATASAIEDSMVSSMDMKKSSRDVAYLLLDNDEAAEATLKKKEKEKNITSGKRKQTERNSENLNNDREGDLNSESDMNGSSLNAKRKKMKVT